MIIPGCKVFSEIQVSQPPAAQSVTHKLRIIRIYSYLPQYSYYGLTGKQRVGVVYVKEA